MAAPSHVSEWTNILNEGAIAATATMPSIADGPNLRIDVAFVMYNGGGTCSPPTTVNCNGVTGQLIGSTGTQTRVSIGIYAFFDADAATISGQTLNSTGGSGSQKTVLVRVLQDARQEIPANVNTGYTTSGAALSISLNRLTESLTTVIAFTSSASTSLPMTNPARIGAISLASGRRVSYGYQNDSLGTSNSGVTSSGYTAAIAINNPSVSLQSIDSVNGGNPLIPGSTGTWTTSGFSPDVNAGSIDGVALTGVTSSGYSIPDYADEQQVPRPGSRTILASNGTQSDTESVPVGVISGYDYQTLSGTLNTGNYSVIQGFSPAAVSGDFIVKPPGYIVGNDGTIMTNEEGEAIFWHIQNSTGIARSYNVTTGAGGVTVSKALTAVGLSASGLTLVGLSAAGL